MKYYAVTDDPTELMHYGVKGMKWGQHIFGDKPRSPAFKKAATKLRASMKNGIKKTKANWKKTSEKRQANKDFKEAKLNAQAEARLNEALGKQANRAAKQEQRAIRREMHKENAAERREERQMNRYLQKARHGTLKYKKIRDDQVQAIAERLNLENQARRLSGNETPHMLTRIKRSIGEGVVRGVGSAVAVGIEESARARIRYKNQKKYGEKMAREEAKAEAAKNKQRIENEKKLAKENAELEADKEYYKVLTQNPDDYTYKERHGRHSKVHRQRIVSQNNDIKKLREERKKLNDLANQNIIQNFTRRNLNSAFESNKDYADRMKQLGFGSAYLFTGEQKEEAFTPPKSRFETFKSRVKFNKYSKSGTANGTKDFNDWVDATESRSNMWTWARRPRYSTMYSRSK